MLKLLSGIEKLRATFEMFVKAVDKNLLEASYKDEANCKIYCFTCPASANNPIAINIVVTNDRKVAPNNLEG